MFKWFNNLRINAKLFAILIVPLASLLYFSFNGVIEKYAVSENMRQVETLAELSTRIGAAAHEIQKERGTTALFLGSQGARSATELKQQRAVTDEKINELQAALQDIEAGLYGGALQAAMDEALGRIESLPEKRAQVDNLQIAGADSFDYYTGVISPLLDGASQVAALSRESEVARQASTYLMLLQAKERAGRERAILSGAFSAGQFSQDQFNQFQANAAEQDTYLGLFLDSATDEQQSFYHSRVTGREVDETAHMKAEALDAGPETSLGLDADAWFEAATARINLLKEVEDRLAEDLANTAERVRQEALRSFWTFAALAAGSVTLALASGFLLSRAISAPLQAMERASTAVAAGDLQQTLAIESHDEIGALAKAFNSMTAQLRNLISSLEERVKDRTKALATVAEVGTATSTILETDKLLQEVVDLTKERFGFYHTHIYLLEEANDTLVLSAGAGDVGRQMVAEGRSIPLSREQSLVARAARERRGVTVNDVTQTPDFLPHPLLPNTRSELAVPMIVGDKVIGVLDAQADQAGRFTDADINIQTTLAAQVAVAVQNAQQFAARKQAEEAVVQRAAELATVARVSSAAATILDADKLLLEVVNLTKEQFNLYHSHIYLLNEAGDTLVLAAGAGEPGRQMVAEGLSIPLDREQSLVARAARDRQGTIVNDVTQAPDFLPNPLLPDTRSELAVPLIVGERVLGVFDVQSDQVDRFTPEDVNIQTTLASQIAVALQNVRAFSQAQRQAERETTLNVIGQKIQSATTVEAVLQIAARELGRALGAPLTIAQLGMKEHNGDRGNE